MPNRAYQLELELRATRGEVARATEAVRLFCTQDGAGDELTHDLCLAVDEVLANIVLHGYAGAPEGRIGLRLSRDDTGYTLEFVDRGRPFNPFEAALPDLEVPAEERAVGGLGVALVRAVVDGFDYVREGDTNCLTLRRWSPRGS